MLKYIVYNNIIVKSKRQFRSVVLNLSTHWKSLGAWQSTDECILSSVILNIKKNSLGIYVLKVQSVFVLATVTLFIFFSTFNRIDYFNIYIWSDC